MLSGCWKESVRPMTYGLVMAHNLCGYSPVMYLATFGEMTPNLKNSSINGPKMLVT